MKNCNKCGSENVETKFITKGSTIDSSSLQKVESEFMSSSEYEIFYKLTAKKDHLRVKCNNCGNVERVRTLDDKSAA